jgi:hypothetical protein
VASLYPLAALPTTADGNVKPPYPGAPHDFFLILCFDPLHGQCPATLRALLGSRHGDLLVYVIRDWPTAMLAVLLACLATWGFRWILPLASRKRSGLTLSSPPGSLQLLLQAGIFFPQPRVLILQTLLLSPYLIQLFLGLAQSPHQLFDPGKGVQRIEIEKQMTL